MDVSHGDRVAEALPSCPGSRGANCGVAGAESGSLTCLVPQPLPVSHCAPPSARPPLSPSMEPFFWPDASLCVELHAPQPLYPFSEPGGIEICD